jgi:hypothetical protein
VPRGVLMFGMLLAVTKRVEGLGKFQVVKIYILEG